MNVMHARGKADDTALIDSHHEVMAFVAQEFGRKPWIDGVVEDTWGDVGKNCLVARTKNFDLQRHVARYLVRLTPPVHQRRRASAQAAVNRATDRPLRCTRCPKCIRWWS